jgi:integrase
VVPLTARRALTKRLIDATAYTWTTRHGERCVLWDGALRGFGLRVYPSGRKTFVLSYRAEGVKRLMELGPYGVLTLDQARDMARLALAEVIRGRDPLAARRLAAHGATMTAFCTTYLERHAKARKKSWEKDERRIERFIKPAWGSRRLSAVHRADVAELHYTISTKSGPYEANRVLALVGKMFECAITWGQLPENSANPARRIPKFPECKRDRFVTRAEMPALLQAIEREQNVYMRAALWLYLLTGLRRSELLTVKHADIDIGEKLLRLADTKAGRPHYLPLSEPALVVIRQIPPVDGNDYLLPGRRPGASLVELKRAWARVRASAGIPDVRLHDLRRTVGSWLAQSGHSLALIGRVLNHSNTSTTAIYARFHTDDARAALEEHAQRIIGIAGAAATAGEDAHG